MLRESLEILESVLNHSGDLDIDWVEALRQLREINFSLDEALIVAITDVQGRITFANQKFCEISKYSREELIGQNHRIINSGYHSLPYFRDMWKTIANGKVWRGEFRNMAKDGTIYWMDTTIVPCLKENGKPYQYVSFRNEITSRKAAEEALRRAETVSAIGQMASGFVHEIRNPLAAMKWSLQLLQMDIPGREQDFDAILTELDRVDGIVGELLTLARPHEVPFGVVHVDVILDAVVNMMRPQAKRQQIELEVSMDEDVPLIRCEPNKLKQVFMNIIKNAIESMPKGGIVAIQAIRSAMDGLEVRIVDQGCGMPEELIARLGQPFVSMKKAGTGLGMMVSYQIIQSHHGRIDIQSQQGKGTTITITLPGVMTEVV